MGLVSKEKLGHSVMTSAEGKTTLAVDPGDVPITKDVIDYHAKSWKNAAGSIVSMYIPVMPELAFTNILSSLPGNTLAIDGGLTFAGAQVALSIYQWRKKAAIEKKHDVRDDALGYAAHRMVYRGPEIVRPDLQLRPGDNIYHIRLPLTTFSEGHITPDRAALIADMQAVSLKQIADATTQKEYVAAVIDTDGYMTGTEPLYSPHNSMTLTREDLFTGKAFSPDNPESPIAMVSKAALEKLADTPQDMFRKAIVSLEADLADKGKRESDFISADIARAIAQPVEDQQETVNQLRIRLQQLFDSEVESLFNGNETVFGRDSNYIPERRRIYSMIRKQQTQYGTRLKKIQYDPADNHDTGVNLDQPIEEVIASEGKEKVLLLANYVNHMLGAYSLSELTREQITDVDMLKQRMAEEGVAFHHTPGSHAQLLSITNKNIIPLLKRASRAGLGTLAIMGALEGLGVAPLPKMTVDLSLLSPIVNLLEKLPGVNGNGTVQDGTSSPQQRYIPPQTHLESSYQPGFNSGEEAATTHTDWEITYGGLAKQGYYSLYTSHTFSDGSWKWTDRVTRNHVYPQIDKRKYSLGLATRQALLLDSLQQTDSTGNAVFKLPIKDRTTVDAVSITKINGKSVPYTASDISDGTVQVRIRPHALPANQPFFVVEELVPDKRSVHATEPITPPIDQRKLTQGVKQVIVTSEANTAPAVSFAAALAGNISLRDKYSVDPKGKEVFNNPLSAEAFVNAALSPKLQGYNCDIADTTLALLSTAHPGKEYLNAAEGYLVGVMSGGKVGSLDQLAKHTFTVSNTGKIYDGTPSVPAQDAVTLGYMYELDTAPPTSPLQQLEQLQQVQKAAAEKQREWQDFLRFSEVLAGLGGAGYAMQRARKKVTRENIGRWKQDWFLRRYNETDLKRAQDFFGWVSWGEPGNKLYPEVETVGTKRGENKQQSKRAVLDTIRTTTHADRIQSYLNDPKELEEKAGVSHTKKIRQLARYLIK